MKSCGALCRVLYWTDYIEPTGVFRKPVNGRGQPDAVVSGQLEQPTALAINFTGRQIVDSLSQHATFSSTTAVLWSPYVIGQTVYIFILFLSSSFFSSPNLSGRRLDVYHTLAHGVALVRI